MGAAAEMTRADRSTVVTLGAAAAPADGSAQGSAPRSSGPATAAAKSATARRPRRALALAYFFPPLGGGGVQRTLKHVKYLPDEGFEPSC